MATELVPEFNKRDRDKNGQDCELSVSRIEECLWQWTYSLCRAGKRQHPPQ